MNSKTILLIIVVLIFGVIALVLTSSSTEEENMLVDYTEVAAYTTDTVVTDPYTVLEGEMIVIENGATITFNEESTIRGAVSCRNGGVRIVAEKKLTIEDTIACEDEEGADVVIVAQGGLEMGSDARIVTYGNVQIVDGTEVLRDEAALRALYDEVAIEPTEGIFIGPFVDETEEGSVDEGSPSPENDTEIDSEEVASFFERFIPIAHAQVQNGTTTVNLTGEPIMVSGKIVVKGPVRRGAKRVVVFDFPNTSSVTVRDFELEGPAGRSGDADTGSCDVKGNDGEDAFRFNAFAPNLTVSNFTLTLGDGGDGGDATTGDDCDDARAEGGKGGKPGNFRMIGSEKFEITGAFMVHPGSGGAGGSATAKGKDGEPGKKGGDAHATGGAGADNKKKLTVSGTVAGTSNVQFGDAVGGFGGGATAEGGKGGDADTCGMTGGAGGNATAKSGRGGDAALTITGGAGRMDFANDIGGQGGMVAADGGVGGTGGDCDENAKGGDGGTGGSASATEGKGGQGKTGRAADGAELADDGGDGGQGGDGCTEGIGGAGGSGGTENGEKGGDGKNICLSITKEEDYISLRPGEIEVIRYKDYYIPVMNLSRFTDASGNECNGEEHWHPGGGGAVELGGMAVPDPDPNNCGFGKTSEVPIEIVEDPNYVAPREENTGGDGRMIQIDPPTLVIPAR